MGSVFDNGLLPIILKTTDGGSTWTKQPAAGNNSQFEDLFFVNPDTGWVVGQANPNGLMLKTTDSGVNWSSVNAPPSWDISAINFISPDHGFLSVHGNSGGSFATVFETENGGDSWTELSERVAGGHISALTVKQGSIHIFAFFYPMTIGIINISTQLASIVVSPASVAMNVGDTQTFIAKGYDQEGGEKIITPSWSTDGGSIDQTGNYHATMAGDFTVTASVTGSTVTGTASVHVTTTGVDRQNNRRPEKFALYQNYPNPFNPETIIAFSVKEKSFVQLEVFDITGKRIVNLVNSDLNSGFYRVSFNARNLATGVYFYQIKMMDFVDVKKMILLE